MKVTYFGTYDSEFTKNKFVIKALKANKVDVLEVHKQTQVTRMDRKGDFGFFSIIKRLGQKLSIIPIGLSSIPYIHETEAILVGYPGHFDIPFAFLLSLLTGIPLFFDPVLILTKTHTKNTGVLKETSFITRLIQWIEKILYKLPKVIFAETEYAKQNFLQLFQLPEEKVHVIPVGADPAFYKPVNKPKSDKFVVTYYGLFIPIHGVDVMINAAELLKNKKDIEFHFIGKGLLYDEMVELAQKKGLKNCKFFPDINEPIALPYLGASDLFLGFMTESEVGNSVIPNKVYQGLALKRCVVSGDSPALRREFTHLETMYYIENDNPKALAHAILRLKKDTVLRESIAKEGYKLFQKKFSPKAIGKKLKEEIKEYKDNHALHQNGHWVRFTH